MTEYVTYMEVSFCSDGVTPTELTETLGKYGWKPCYGRYDYVYDWGNNWGNKDTNIHEFLEYINKVHETLRNYKMYYSIRTYQRGSEDFPVWGHY
ncbi:MAG: hypothetical protein JSW00_13410 [Thermoplasmata archaeon]|nr:MAG: hypothetical protein JSW00_13410 [Thermoplasmata archaeon]